MALFDALSPELATDLPSRLPEGVRTVWKRFERVYATWWRVGRERQVHYGENCLDPPDLAVSGLGVYRWLLGAPGESLARRVALPFCRADWFHVQKLAWALDVLSVTNETGVVTFGDSETEHSHHRFYRIQVAANRSSTQEPGPFRW